MIELIKNKKTAIQDEQQLSKHEIVEEIISLLHKHNLTILEAREILMASEKMLYKQKITFEK